jgi:hypothetical protein
MSARQCAPAETKPPPHFRKLPRPSIPQHGGGNGPHRKPRDRRGVRRPRTRLAISRRHKEGTTARDPSSRLRRTRIARFGRRLSRNQDKLIEASWDILLQMRSASISSFAENRLDWVTFFLACLFDVGKDFLHAHSLRAGTMSAAGFPGRVIPNCSPELAVSTNSESFCWASNKPIVPYFPIPFLIP